LRWHGCWRKSRGLFQSRAQQGSSGWKRILEAVEIELTQDDLREIETAASQIEVQGARYP
jgi:hypothetical protein